jgi:hypothetical protein
MQSSCVKGASRNFPLFANVVDGCLPHAGSLRGWKSYTGPGSERRGKAAHRLGAAVLSTESTWAGESSGWSAKIQRRRDPWAEGSPGLAAARPLRRTGAPGRHGPLPRGDEDAYPLACPSRTALAQKAAPARASLGAVRPPTRAGRDPFVWLGLAAHQGRVPSSWKDVAVLVAKASQLIEPPRRRSFDRRRQLSRAAFRRRHLALLSVTRFGKIFHLVAAPCHLFGLLGVNTQRTMYTTLLPSTTVSRRVRPFC